MKQKTARKGGFFMLQCKYENLHIRSNGKKARHVKDIKKVYDGCYCPICGRPIKTSGYVFDDDFVESEVEE